MNHADKKTLDLSRLDNWIIMKIFVENTKKGHVNPWTLSTREQKKSKLLMIIYVFWSIRREQFIAKST